MSREVHDEGDEMEVVSHAGGGGYLQEVGADSAASGRGEAAGPTPGHMMSPDVGPAASSTSTEDSDEG